MSRYLERVARLRETMAQQQAEALLLVSAANVRYLSGFRGEGYLVVGKDDLLISTDGRYKGEAAELSDEYRVNYHSSGHLAGAIEFLRERNAGVVAFEAEELSYAVYREIATKLPEAQLNPASKWVEVLRLIKDEDEIALVAEAARRVDVALNDFLSDLQPGQSERLLALELEMALARAGTASAFAIIMAAGESAAEPHHVPTDRLLNDGEMLKIDVGGKLEGYCSDLTRTYFLGEPNETFRQVYRIVLEAQEAAVAAAGPGVPAKHLDEIAREIIGQAGYAGAFSHGLGHGVGLQVHEGPRVSGKSEDILQPGMLVTIEPGIYRAGWGGVRIEDTVLITEDGHRVLTHAPKPQY